MDELPRVILFDLDGTLLDTAPELANSLNQLRKDRDLSALPYDIIRNQVSKGSQKIKRLPP